MPKKLINISGYAFPVKLLALLVLWFAFLFVCLSFTSSDPLKKPKGIEVVVIDAGHGGKDPGCNGVTHKEKDVTLAIALKLGKLIEDNLKDVKVIYTRKTDVFIELEERAQIANRNNADLFISIHCNAAAKYVYYKGKDGKQHVKTWKDKKGKVHNKEVVNPIPYGSDTYVMGIKNEKGHMEVAKRENAAMLLEDNYETTYNGFDPNSDEAYIIMSMFASANVEQSAQFAAKIQKEYSDKAGRIDKGVQRQSIWVLWRTTMPSILTEVGFLTNPQEEKFLASEKGQKYMASAIFRALRSYKNEQEGKTITYNDDLENQTPLENENVIYQKEHPNGEEEVVKEQVDSADAKDEGDPELDKIMEKYNAIIKQADGKMKEHKHDEAKDLYNKALEVKKDDNYAKTKLTEIDSLKNDKALKQQEEEKNKALKESEKKYKELIAKADNLYNEKKWQDAKKAYIDAAVYNPGDKYPKVKIKEIEGIQKDLEDKQAAADTAEVKPKDLLNNYSNQPKKEEPKKEEPKPVEVKEDEPKKVGPVAKADVIEFRVQFASSDKEIPKDDAQLKGLEDVRFYKSGIMYKYTAGNYPRPSEAVKYQNKIRNMGYKDAFVVAFKNGERIDYNEAMKLIQ